MKLNVLPNVIFIQMSQGQLKVKVRLLYIIVLVLSKGPWVKL